MDSSSKNCFNRFQYLKYTVLSHREWEPLKSNDSKYENTNTVYDFTWGHDLWNGIHFLFNGNSLWIYFCMINACTEKMIPNSIVLLFNQIEFEKRISHGSFHLEFSLKIKLSNCRQYHFRLNFKNVPITGFLLLIIC